MPTHKIAEASLFIAPHLPLAYAVFQGFDNAHKNNPRPETVGLIPSLGFLGIDDGEGRKLVGFQSPAEIGSGWHTFYNHPRALQGKRYAPQVIGAYAIDLPLGVVIEDKRARSDCTWRGRIASTVEQRRQPIEDVIDPNVDMLLGSQPLSEGVVQALRSRTRRLDTMMPPAMITLLNEEICAVPLGTKQNLTF